MGIKYLDFQKHLRRFHSKSYESGKSARGLKKDLSMDSSWLKHGTQRVRI